ncbi:unnamed protein product [Urochloa humidicola]
MEEGAAVTVATGALGPVLVKLGALLGNNLLEGRREASDIKAIKSELEAVSPLLTRRPEAGDWMGEARELFYDIDDAVEDLMLDLCRSDSAFAEEPINPFLNLRTKLREVTKRCRARLEAMTPDANFPNRHSKPAAVDPRGRFLHRDSSELVGMDEQRAQVMKLLQGDLQKLKMVCIVGFAGAGKTTLADLVYHAIGERFQCRAFASLSPGSTTTDFLKAILRQVTDASIQSAGTQVAVADTEENLLNYISNVLADKRYLIVVDDIWHPEEWEIIVNAFPENHMGSKIILTTTMNAVAVKFCTDAFSRQRNAFVHELRGIDCYDAMKLSEAVTIKGSETRDLLAVSLEDLWGNIEFMSRGMPLALHCLSAAAADSLVQGDYDGWAAWIQNVQYGFMSIRFLKPLVDSLCLVYNSLPIHLKTCLLYCATYPDFLSANVLTEVQRIEKHSLIRKWIAEGFVYKMEAAETYFDELVSRKLLLPHPSGQMFYQTHPLMLPFLACKSKEANFFTCWPDDRGSAKRIRRLVFHHCYSEYDSGIHRLKKEVSGIQVTSHTRSLVISPHGSAVPVLDDNEYFVYQQNRNGIRISFNKLEHLRVLDLEQVIEIGNDSLVDICKLLCLRYLGLKGCSKITVLPRQIGRLQNLQTLDITSTGVTDLPTEVWELKHLETLNVGNTMIREIPRGIGKLQHLKTLNVSDTRVIELPWEGCLILNSVRVLAGDNHCPQLVKFSDGLRDIWQALENGIIMSSPRAMCRQDLSIMLFNHFGLSWGPLLVTGLKVSSRHTNIPRWVKEHLTDVSSLDIRLCRLEDDDLEFLRQMPNLQALALRFEILPRKPIAITAGGFSKLESFLVDCRLPLATFKQGAMPNLKHLEFKFYTGQASVYLPMGITHLQSIEKVVFWSSKYYRSDCPGINAMLKAVREEAREHPNRISFWINGREEVLPHKKSSEVCEEDNINGAGSNRECGNKIRLCGNATNYKGKAIQPSNHASSSRTTESHEIEDAQE